MKLERLEQSFLEQAAKQRKNFSHPVIAILGSHGKTATALMLSSILAQKGRVLANAEHADDPAGIILTLLKLNSAYDFAVLKIGTRDRNDMQRLAATIAPTVVIVTHIGENYLPTPNAAQELIDAFGELLRALPPEGLAILNKDSEFTTTLQRLASSQRVVKFGLHPSADCRADYIQPEGPHGIKFIMLCDDANRFALRLPVYSLDDVYNSMAAITAAFHLGVDVGTIKSALEAFRLPVGRGRLHDFGDYRIIDETSACSPHAIMKAAATLCHFKAYSQKLIFILGDVAGPPELAREQHRHIGAYRASLPIDVIITVGEYAGGVAAGFKSHGLKSHSKARNEIFVLAYLRAAVAAALDRCEAGVTILVAGSVNLKMNEIVEQLVQRGCGVATTA